MWVRIALRLLEESAEAEREADGAA